MVRPKGPLRRPKAAKQDNNSKVSHSSQFLSRLGMPSKEKKNGFKDIVPKGGRGSGPNPKICCM